MNNNKSEKGKMKHLQDKCQYVLNMLVLDEDNKYCVDCDAKGPRWASWNIGIFLCIRCAGIHRNLGVHISKVRSVNLDSWTPEQVMSIKQMGNSRARAIYEANLPDKFHRPNVDSSLEAFIRAKYEHKKYIAREWVPTTLCNINWEHEINQIIEAHKQKKNVTTITKSSTKLVTEKKSNIIIEIPKLPKLETINSKVKTKEIITNDLLDIHCESTEEQSTTLKDSTLTLISSEENIRYNKGDNKEKEIIKTIKDEEDSFLNQTTPVETGKVKLTKDNIMALYQQNYIPPQPQNFGISSSLFNTSQLSSGQNFAMFSQSQTSIHQSPNTLINTSIASSQFRQHPMQNGCFGMSQMATHQSQNNLSQQFANININQNNDNNANIWK